jgi:hypothetical protein
MKSDLIPIGALVAGTVLSASVPLSVNKELIVSSRPTGHSANWLAGWLAGHPSAGWNVRIPIRSKSNLMMGG